MCCRRRRPYLDLEERDREIPPNWYRIAKKVRHIRKLGRYMAYIGHYLNELRLIGGRPSRSEIAWRNRMRRNSAVWPPRAEEPDTDVPAGEPDAATRADPEPEPQ